MTRVFTWFVLVEHDNNTTPDIYRFLNREDVMTSIHTTYSGVKERTQIIESPAPYEKIRVFFDGRLRITATPLSSTTVIIDMDQPTHF